MTGYKLSRVCFEGVNCGDGFFGVPGGACTALHQLVHLIYLYLLPCAVSAFPAGDASVYVGGELNCWCHAWPHVWYHLEVCVSSSGESHTTLTVHLFGWRFLNCRSKVLPYTGVCRFIIALGCFCLTFVFPTAAGRSFCCLLYGIPCFVGRHSAVHRHNPVALISQQLLEEGVSIGVLSGWRDGDGVTGFWNIDYRNNFFTFLIIYGLIFDCAFCPMSLNYELKLWINNYVIYWSLWFNIYVHLYKLILQEILGEIS